MSDANFVSLLEWANSGISAERARQLWDAHVRSSGDWKKPVQAHVPADLVHDVKEAMAFFGAPVDICVEKTLEPGIWMLGSRGYYHHIG